MATATQVKKAKKQLSDHAVPCPAGWRCDPCKDAALLLSEDSGIDNYQTPGTEEASED